MTRKEHIEKISEIEKYNQEIKCMLGKQNTILSAMKRYTSADVDEAYQRGVNDAWECARKIALNVEYDVSADALRDAFNVTTCYDIFIKYSAQEVIKKMEEYEKQKDAIKVGDEVKLNHDNIKATVMDKSDNEDMWWLYTENGCIEEWQDVQFRKTGRTFPQIEEVLKAMQEGTEL